MPLYVYRPKAQLLAAGMKHGFIDELADEMLSKALIKAREIDAEEQANGEVEDTARLVVAVSLLTGASSKLCVALIVGRCC